jgi:hypothetical protein
MPPLIKQIVVSSHSVFASDSFSIDAGIASDEPAAAILR